MKKQSPRSHQQETPQKSYKISLRKQIEEELLKTDSLESPLKQQIFELLCNLEFSSREEFSVFYDAFKSTQEQLMLNY